MRRPPKRMLRARRRKQPIRVVGTVVVTDEPEPLPLVDPAGLDHLDQMALDRTIAEATGLTAWVRPMRSDDLPDPVLVIDPTPERLAEAEAIRREFAANTHVIVVVLAPGLRARRPLNVYSQSELN